MGGDLNAQNLTHFNWGSVWIVTSLKKFFETFTLQFLEQSDLALHERKTPFRVIIVGVIQTFFWNLRTAQAMDLRA